MPPPPGQKKSGGHDHGQPCGGGSGVDGIPRDYELAPDAAPGIDDQTAKAIQRDVARAVRDAVARGQGNVSGGMADWAAEVLRPPKVPWQSVFRHVLGRATAKAGKQDYSYRRPHRRQSLTPDVLRPGQIAYPVNVGLVVDVSRSMGDQGPRVLAEVKALSNAASKGNVKAWAVNTDATVQKDLRRWKQGGGTDMRPGIAAALKAKVDVIVVITDGGTPWPDAPLAKPLIVVLVGDHRQNTAPSWARVIEVEG
jgi:predicted metal-dependent peptidase